MSPSAKRMTSHRLSEDQASGIKNRMKILLIASTLSVALAFGLSFYFALVSNESAIASQVPELEAVVSKLKSLLLINTLGFVAIIIASFYILTSIVGSKMFHSIATVQMDLTEITEGKLPNRSGQITEKGPFSGLNNTFEMAVSALRDKENKEVDELSQCLVLLSDSSKIGDVQKKLEKVLKSKNSYLGLSDDRNMEKEIESSTLSEQPI